MSHADTNSQPAPKPNDKPAVWSMVMRDMVDRDIFGAEKYHTRLQPGNGRDFLVDAYQEALDLVVYLRGAIYERDNTGTKESRPLGGRKATREITAEMVIKAAKESADHMSATFGQQNQLSGGPMLRCPDCIAEHCACIAS